MELLLHNAEGLKLLGLSKILNKGWHSRSEIANLSQSLKELSPQQSASNKMLTRMVLLSEGFFDSHMHPLSIYRRKNQIDLKSITKIEDLINVQKECTLPLNLAFGWNESKMNTSLDDLERIFSKKFNQKIPFVATRICSHKALITDAAKKQFGINCYGHYITENDLEKVESLSEVTEDAFSIFQNLSQMGISSCADLYTSAEGINIYKNIFSKKANLIPPNLCVQLFLKDKDLSKIDAPFKQVHEKNSLHLRHVKFFLDGSLGAQTAWLSSPYSDNDQSVGLSLWKDEDLIRECRAALQKGFLLAFHAIGDVALDQALMIAEFLSEEMKEAIDMQADKFLLPARHRLEHLMVCRDDQIQKIKDQDFWSIGLQPSHKTFDKGFSTQRLGEKRLREWGYRLKSFIDMRIPVCLGSDAPIASPDPRYTIESACFDERESERIDYRRCLDLMSYEGKKNAGIHSLPPEKLFLSY